MVNKENRLISKHGTSVVEVRRVSDRGEVSEISIGKMKDEDP